MNFFKKSLAVLTTALLAAPLAGFAQYKYEVQPLLSYFKDAKRYELGFNYSMPNADFVGVTTVNNSNGSFFGDSNTTRKIVATGIGGDLGLSLPFKGTGHISCWAVSFHLMGNMFTWDQLNATQLPDGTVKAPTKSLTASTIQVSLPLGIDWMVGNHCINTKRLPFGTGLGVGVIPQVDMTTLSNPTKVTVDPKMSLGCTPYAKAELSIFAGIDFKIRAMYTMGTITMIDVNKALPSTTDGPFKINYKSNFMVSFIIMPFSHGWHEWDWYNTFDTYSQHDRLN